MTVLDMYNEENICVHLCWPTFVTQNMETLKHALNHFSTPEYTLMAGLHVWFHAHSRKTRVWRFKLAVVPKTQTRHTRRWQLAVWLLMWLEHKWCATWHVSWTKHTCHVLLKASWLCCDCKGISHMSTSVLQAWQHAPFAWQELLYILFMCKLPFHHE